MGITVMWDNHEKTVVRHHYEGSWDWQDYYVAADEAWALMRSVEHDVDAILDVRLGSPLPSGLLPHAKRIVTQRPTNAGLIVVVGASSIIKTMWIVYRKVYGRLNPRFNIEFADTLEEARRIIATSHASLSSVKDPVTYPHLS